VRPEDAPGAGDEPHIDDFHMLLRAFAGVAERHPDAHLVHTGRIAERYAPAELRALAGRGADRVHLLGFLEDPADLERLMADAAVLVQPGAPTDFNRLRLPAKVHDYLAAGRPTVTFAVGVGELLTDREDAVLTRTADPSELADAIRWLLDDPGRAEAVGAAGQRRARALFDPGRIAAETVRHYEAAGAAPAQAG